MAKGKKRHGRRGALSKIGRKVGSLAGTGIQLIGALHGVIYGVTSGFTQSNPALFPREMVWGYTGYNIESGQWDQQRALQSATILGVTFLVGWGIKQIARRM